MATYLELVNSAIRESGLDLDQLTSGTFASPPDPMHVRFKTWVSDSWKELQMERNWEFTQTAHLRTNNTASASPQGQALVNTSTDYTYPFLVIVGDISTVSCVAGAWVEGIRSGAYARLLCAVQQDADNLAWDQGVYPEQGFRTRLYIYNGSGEFEFGEGLNIYGVNTTFAGAKAGGTTAVSANASVCDLNAYRLTSYSGFDLGSASNEFSYSTDNYIIDRNSFVAVPKTLYFSTPNAAIASIGFSGTQTEQVSPSPLTWLDWDDFKALAYSNNKTMLGSDSCLGVPKYVTKDNMGYYRFFPTIDYRNRIAWDIYFDAQIQILGLPSTVATASPIILPSKYHDIIYWKAVCYYADYDAKPELWKRANGRYRFYKQRLEESLIEVPKWEPSRYNPRLGGGKR